MRRKHAMITNGKRAFAGVLAAAMLAAAAPAAYAEDLPAAQAVTEASTEETAQDVAEDAAEQTHVLQARIDALPTAEEFEALADGTTTADSTLNQAQTDVYNEAQAIADALEQLSEEEQAQIDTAKLEALFDFVNGQVALMDDAQYDADFSEIPAKNTSTGKYSTMLNWYSGLPTTNKLYKAGNGTIAWNATEKKLTLNNATVNIELNGGGAIRLPSGQDVTVELIGDNTFIETGSNGGETQSQGFFYVYGGLTFTGDGNLTMNGSSQGMTVTRTGNVIFNQTGTITINARNCGIQQQGNITVNTGKLYVSASLASSNVRGIWLIPSSNQYPANFVVNNGYVEVRADNATGNSSGGIYSTENRNSKIAIHGGEVKASAACEAIYAGWETITIDGTAKVTATSKTKQALGNCAVSGSAVVNAETESGNYAISLKEIRGTAQVTGSGYMGGVSIGWNTFVYDGDAVVISKGETAQYGTMSGDLQYMVRKNPEKLYGCKISVDANKTGENATVWDWDYNAHPLGDSTYKYIKIEKCDHSGAKDDGNCTTAVYCPDCGGKLKLFDAQAKHTYASTWTDEGNGVHSRQCTNTLYKGGQCESKITVSAPDVAATYDGNSHGITVTAPDGATVEYKNGDSYTSVIPSYTNAGTYTVCYKVTVQGVSLESSAKVIIEKKPVTVTPVDQSKVYGDDDPELTCTASGVLESEPLVGIRLTRAAGEDAGGYAITAAADETANPNYALTFEQGKFTIAPKPITGATVKLGTGLTANGREQTQIVEKVLLGDKELPADSYTVTGNTATNAGSYTLTITASGNYTGSIEWTYVVAPAKSTTSQNSSTVKAAAVPADDTPTPAATAAPSTLARIPQTSDASHPMLYAVLLVASLFGLAVTFLCKRKNNK